MVSYASAVRELFGGVADEAFVQRLGSLVLHFRGSFWINRKHEFNTRLLLRLSLIHILPLWQGASA